MSQSATHPLAAGPPIPFNRPWITDAEVQLVIEALHDAHLSGDGPFTRQASEALSNRVGGCEVLLTTSCTHALEMSAHLLDLRPEDEVIMPSFTFVSTANAYVARRATPVFVDIREDTLNIDERQIGEAITKRTKAIVVVHYAGIPAEMDQILEIADRHGLVVIEDNAHGLGSTYWGRPLGSIGSLATQSFHATKNVSAGEGGALVFGDPSYRERAEIIREKGTNRSQFLRGAVDKYTWVDVGSSYLPSEVIAALLLAQLNRFEEIQRERHSVWERYRHELGPWASSSGVKVPTVPEGTTHSAHLFYLVVPDDEGQSTMIEHLRRLGITATSHYRPLHSSPGGRRFGRAATDCAVTTRVADRIVRLPLFAPMSESEIDRVLSAVTSAPI